MDILNIESVTIKLVKVTSHSLIHKLGVKCLLWGKHCFSSGDAVENRATESHAFTNLCVDGRK